MKKNVSPDYEDIQEDFYFKQTLSKNPLRKWFLLNRYRIANSLVISKYKNEQKIIDFGHGTCDWNTENLLVFGVDTKESFLKRAKHENGLHDYMINDSADTKLPPEAFDIATAYSAINTKNEEKKPGMDDWEFTILRTFKEIEAIRDIWEEMQRHEPYSAINADIDGYLSVVKASGDSLQPYIILVKQGNTPRAIIIAVRQKLSIPLKLGYMSLLSPKLESLTVVYGGILGQPNSEVCSFCINKLLRILRSREIDTIFFNHLRTESDFYKMLTTQAAFLSLDGFPVIEPHWAISMPDTMDQLYQRYSPRNRSNLRRLIRRLEKTYNGNMKVMTYTQEDEVDEAIEVMAKISAQTYQSQLYNLDSKQIRDLLRLAATRGWLRAYVLFINEEPAAFELALRYRQSYFGLHTGFDPKWKQYRIGTVIMLKFLESICGDPEVKFFDFGFGDAHYKRLYADLCWQEASVYLFALRPFPLLINFLHSTTKGISLGINWSLKKTGLTGRIKRLWKNRLEVKASENGTLN